MAGYTGPRYGTGHQAPSTGQGGGTNKSGGYTPTPARTPKPGKPRPQKPSVVKSRTLKAATAPAPKYAGIKNAGAHTNPSGKPASFYTAPGSNGKNKAVAAAKAHAASDTASTSVLGALTPAQIKQQAKNTIGAAYKSSFGDVNSQQKQDAAINAKRAQDNKVYENWVASQTSGILAQGSAADANFATAQANSSSALAAAAPDSAALEATANQRQGNVSSNGASSTLGAGVVANTARDSAHAAIGDQLDLSNVKNSGDLLRATAVNGESRVGETIQKQQADYNTALTALATQKSKLQLSKAGDIAKEIARLQGVEIQKAETAQNYTLAQQTLGGNIANDQAQNANTAAEIVAGVTKSKIQAKEYFAGLNSREAIAKYDQLNENQRAQLASQTSLTENQQRQALANKVYLHNVQKDGAAQAAVIWKEQHPNSGKSPSSHPDGSPLTINEENTKYSQIQSVSGGITGLMKQYAKQPGSDTKVYQALLTGAPIVPTTSATGKVTYHPYGPPIPAAILNAALTLSRNQPLTPGEIQKLRAIGLRNVTQHLG